MIADDEVMKVITNQKVKTQRFPAVFIYLFSTEIKPQTIM